MAYRTISDRDRTRSQPLVVGNHHISAIEHYTTGEGIISAIQNQRTGADVSDTTRAGDIAIQNQLASIADIKGMLTRG